MGRLILASTSPRRRELLELIGVKFDIYAPETDEGYDPSLGPEGVVASISRKKAEAALRGVEKDAVVVAADTMVFLDDLRLGKPKSPSEARAMLASLSGRTHRVCTGVTACGRRRMETRVETTEVDFRPLTQGEIDAYVATGEPMDKAGAYGVQGRGALLVSGIRGDFFNVMGLPLCLLGQMLREFGVAL